MVSELIGIHNCKQCGWLWRYKDDRKAMMRVRVDVTHAEMLAMRDAKAKQGKKLVVHRHGSCFKCDPNYGKLPAIKVDLNKLFGGTI